jgi:hypothetical protein
VVRQPGLGLGVSVHSVICGLLARPELLDAKTQEFRELYERHSPDGARRLYDEGIEYLKRYYARAGDFDPHSVTTLLSKDAPVVQSLRADPRCSLVFYVFDLADKSEEGRFRCLQLDGHAETLESGPVYENVWWHNTLFHGPADDHVVVHFRHARTHDTRFGAFEEVAA